MQVKRQRAADNSRYTLQVAAARWRSNNDSVDDGI